MGQTNSKQQRSPYVVLGLNKTNATTSTTTTTTTTTNLDGIKEITKNEIQLAFRLKAKLYHPDLNPSQLPTAECEQLMTELVEAYQLLMENDGDDFISKYQVGYSNKVAIACELYTIKELQMDRFHSVYPIRIDYEYDEDFEHEEFDDDDDDDDDEKLNNDPIDDMVRSADSNSLSTVTVTPIQTHPDDSVSDFKRQLESQYGIEWGLLSASTAKDNDSNNNNNNSSSSDGNRKVDRDGITIGWEVIVVRQQNDNNSNNNNNNSNKENNKLLSNHFFLGDDYQIKQGEIVYAVIRK